MVDLPTGRAHVAFLSGGDQADMDSLKTREDYLIEFEKKLLGILEDLYKSINRNMVTTYGLALLVGVVCWGAIPEISYSGAKLKKADVLVFMPLLISAIYILIDYQLLRISTIFRELESNSNELLTANKHAKAVSIQNVHLLGAGITGLILSLSRWQATRLLRRHPFRNLISNLFTASEGNLVLQILTFLLRLFRLSHRCMSWAARITAQVSVTLALFFLPVILTGYYVYVELFLEKQLVHSTAYLPLGGLIAVSISTVVSGAILFTSYMADFLGSFMKDISESSQEIKRLGRIVAVIALVSTLLTSDGFVERKPVDPTERVL